MVTFFNALADDKSADYLKKNIAITEVKARNVGIDKFVIEMLLIDFSKSSSLPEGFGFIIDVTFADNGKEYDLKAGDGIYTSVQTYTLEELIRMGGTKISGTPKIYIDEAFQHIEGLEKVPGIKVKCRFSFCCNPCPGGRSCPACDWWGGWCVEYYDYEVELYIHFLD